MASSKDIGGIKYFVHKVDGIGTIHTINPSTYKKGHKDAFKVGSKIVEVSKATKHTFTFTREEWDKILANLYDYHTFYNRCGSCETDIEDILKTTECVECKTLLEEVRIQNKLLNKLYKKNTIYKIPKEESIFASN